MSFASLWNFDEATFAFEHAMAHRVMLGVMSPLDRFSKIPYFIEPMTAKRPADAWHLDHQQAHDDALTTLPTAYGAVTVGLQIGGNLVDSDLNDLQVRAWWTHQNHIEHHVAGGTILPPAAMAPPTWQFPFW